MIQQIKLLLYITYHLALEKKEKRKETRQKQNKRPDNQSQQDNQN